MADGYLVPPRGLSVPVQFHREGIKYADLSPDQQEKWDALEWSEGEPPEQVDPAALNSWLFNADTVDKVLQHLMENGLKVAGGDRLGKTIIFARNTRHAQFIAERFNKHYPEFRGRFARVITHGTEYAQSLIDDFSKKDRDPHIAISVDMLDTGIDVPEVLNLVFFKPLHSRTKFWQMLGRGTRLCPDLFGPGQDKEFFYVFDYCGNLEYFGQNLTPADAPLVEPLSKRIFKARLGLIEAVDKREPSPPPAPPLRIRIPHLAAAESSAVYDAREISDRTVRDEAAETLRARVAAMNTDNFVVRPKRKLVERYSDAAAWHAPTDEDLTELAREVAGLPTQLPEEPDEEAKRFDLLMLRLQLAVLGAGGGFTALRRRVQALARSLEEKSSIPAVRAQMELIEAVAADEWWRDVTVPMIEVARKRLRGLVKLAEKGERRLIFTDFEDRLGPGLEVEFAGLAEPHDFERFRAKARHFLRAHEDHVAIHKLRLNQPLTPQDLAELERMLLEAGVANESDLDRARQTSSGLGLFVRSLVGLDREAPKSAFGEFLAGGTASANQIEFINMLVDHLTDHGQVAAELLYHSPFTDLNSQGPDGIFNPDQVQRVIAILDQIRQNALAA